MPHGRAHNPVTRVAAPREDRSAVIIPAFDAVPALVAENLQARREFRYDFSGRSYEELSSAARTDLFAAARRWTAAYRKVELTSDDPAGPIYLAGHQPELFHPGVWFKNFALGAVAAQGGAAAVNLIIDSDTAKSTSLITPTGTVDDPRREAVLFDQPGARIPFEERAILDRELFAGFGRRLTGKLSSLVPNPLLRDFWPLAVERAAHVDRLGYCLAQARHQWEGRWGLETLEVPQSAVCSSDAFRWFVLHLLSELPRFRETYNAAVHEYRRANRIRNAAHPVPDLAADGAWLEAPLWIWTADRPQRRRLFARSEGGETTISDRAGLELRVPLAPGKDASQAAKMLAEWSQQGVKIRSRALVTTLWARLALSDLFLHGIGGAKYDQVTDRLIENFFGRRPPGIMVVSATLYLPVNRPQTTAEQIRSIHRELRDLTFHPEIRLRNRSDAPNGALGKLLAEKTHWIAATDASERGYQRWRALRHVNEQLQAWLTVERQQLVEAERQWQNARRREHVLGSREYGAWLYPEKMLQEFLAALLPKR